MGQPQESKSEDEKNEGAKAAKNSGVVCGLFGPVRNMLLGAGILVGGTGCGGEKPEAPKSPLDVRVPMVVPEKKACLPEGGMGGEVKEKGKKKEEESAGKNTTLSLADEGIRRHPKTGQHYLGTIDTEKGGELRVWKLLTSAKGLSEPPIQFTAVIQERVGKTLLIFDGRTYQEVPAGVWGEMSPPAKADEPRPKEKEIIPPTPSFHKLAEEKISPLGSHELTRALYGSATVNGNQLTIIDTKGMYHAFSFCGGTMQPIPPGHYPIQGVFHAVPGEEKGHRNIFLAVGWSTIPGPRGVMRIPPTKWQWLETGPVTKMADVSLDTLRARAEEAAARARAAEYERKTRQSEREKQEIVKEQVSRLMNIVRISGKTFTDQRGVVWTHSGGYFPSLSPGRIDDATMRVENPQWGRDARGSDILIGGTHILRWRVEGRGYVEFRAPVEQKK